RSGVPAGDFDDVVFGESMQGGGVIARHAALVSGLEGVPGIAHNRHCATGLSAIQTAAAGVMAGMNRAVVAGGVESLSTAPVMRRFKPGTEEAEEPWRPPSHPDMAEAPAGDMSITVGWNTARLASISREDMDAWALRSHQRAVQAIDEGRFTEEIVPLLVTRPDGSRTVFDTDEHPRRGTTAEKLAALKPLHPEIPGFSITAGNSSGLNDAAAAVVVTSAEYAEEHGLPVLAVIRSWASVGVDPVRTGLAPVKAVPQALEKAGLTVGDVELFEINEAFASVPIAAVRELGLDEERVNISGSGCSLGHPIAATGARMVTTLVNDLARRGGGVGVAAMCAGGGM